jgi:ATP-dependent RNA helicase RhlE
MPGDIARLAGEMLSAPERVEIAPQGRTAERIDQKLYHVPMPQKRQLLVELLKDEAMKRVIVFTRTKHGANRVAQHLAKNGTAAEAIHGNKSQNARQRAMEAFRNGRARVLVATDIAARGIDIDNISHVVNFELPNEPESYVHRIGRTARAGETGIAISFCDPSERSYLRDIEKLTCNRIAVLNHDLPPVPEGQAGQKQDPPRDRQKPQGFKPKKKNGSRPHWRRNRDKRRDAA